jgi:hypothetical protein
MTKAQCANQKIEQVLSFKGQQVTGVSINNNGRIFANFPRWHNIVVELINVKLNGFRKIFYVKFK